MTQKEYQQKHIKETIAATQRNADNFKNEKSKIEAEWDKYFQEITKHSDKFRLVKTSNSQTWGVNVCKVDSEGKTINNYDRIKIGEISTDYNDMSIEYIGELPEGTHKNSIRISVEEHTTNPRGSWRSVSHGYKLKVRTSYEDNKTYYKTGKPVIKIVEDYVQSIWSSHNNKLKQDELRVNAFRKAFDTYKSSVVDFGGNYVNGIATNRNQIVVKNLNGTVVILSYHDVNGEVVFNVEKTIINGFSADSIIEALGSMK
jgi:hypothetical protein